MSNSTLEVYPEQSAAWAITYCPQRDRFLIPKELNAVSAVYLIENTVTGRRYVGSSAIVGKRIGKHLNQTPSNPVMATDMEVHGRKSFVASILQILPDLDSREECEHSWIKQILPEYNNHHFSGSGHRTIKAETRAKLSASAKVTNVGRRHSPETRARIGLSQIGRDSPMSGRNHSEETRARMRAGHAGRIVTEEMRAALRRGWADRRERHETEAAWMMAIMLHCGWAVLEN